MWDQFYDVVKYSHKTDKMDSTGSPIYTDEIDINVRDVSGGSSYEIKQDGLVHRITREYQVPFMVYVDDKIDGRVVVQADPSRGVFGEFYFCIARVE